MTRLTVILGAALVVTGVIAFALTATSVTALIPAFVGVAILVCAGVASRPKLHRHGIHAALAVALIGALGSLMNVARIGELFAGTAERPAAIVTSVVLFVLCLGYVVIGIRSFVLARRARSS